MFIYIYIYIYNIGGVRESCVHAAQYSIKYTEFRNADCIPCKM